MYEFCQPLNDFRNSWRVLNVDGVNYRSYHWIMLES